MNRIDRAKRKLERLEKRYLTIEDKQAWRELLFPALEFMRAADRIPLARPQLILHAENLLYEFAGYIMTRDYEDSRAGSMRISRLDDMLGEVDKLYWHRKKRWRWQIRKESRRRNFQRRRAMSSWTTKDVISEMGDILKQVDKLKGAIHTTIDDSTIDFYNKIRAGVLLDVASFMLVAAKVHLQETTEIKGGER